MNELSSNPEATKLLRSAPCTTVMMRMTVKAGLDPMLVMPHMKEELRATVQLYLEGKIVQWYAQCDAPGVVFHFQAGSVEQVQAWIAQLPLVQQQLVDVELQRLGPLMPLGLMFPGGSA